MDDLQQLESTFFKKTVEIYKNGLKSQKHLATFSDAGNGGPWGAAGLHQYLEI
jgi:hypothetical protein